MSDALDQYRFQHQLTMLIWLLSVLDTTCRLSWTTTGKLIFKIMSNPIGFYSDAGSTFSGGRGAPPQLDLQKLDKMINVHSELNCKMYFC